MQTVIQQKKWGGQNFPRQAEREDQILEWFNPSKWLCAVDAQRMHSVTTAVVEAKKDRCANDAAP